MNNNKGPQGSLQTDSSTLAGHTTQLDDFLHSIDSPLDPFIKEFFSNVWKSKEVHTPRVFRLKSLGDVRQKPPVDVVCQERSERCQSSSQGEEDFKKCVQRIQSVIDAELTLEPLPIESDVPVGCVVY